MKKPAVVDCKEFYNSALDHIDLMKEYHAWLNPRHPGGFSYCYFPFILSIAAKKHILNLESEHQMMVSAKQMMGYFNLHLLSIPVPEVFYLNINVSRHNIVTDSIKELGRQQKEFKKKLRVTFEGEIGIDLGGLTKEWFILLIKNLFEPKYAMFTYHETSRRFWFSTSCSERLEEYNLLGVLMGLAAYNNVILDVNFPIFCYKKLLSDGANGDGGELAGVSKNLTLDDLLEVMPEAASSLKCVVEYEGDVEEDLCLGFEVTVEEFGNTLTFDLVENGREKAVTNENREEFVRLYVDFFLNTSVAKQFQSFYLGFRSALSSNALLVRLVVCASLFVSNSNYQLFTAEELEVLICGTHEIDFCTLRLAAEYDGYEHDDQLIIDLWDILTSFSDELKKKFLIFVSGSNRIPIQGMSMKISSSLETDQLPQSHTCFNHLVLPMYANKNILKEKLIIAIQNEEGFGLE